MKVAVFIDGSNLYSKLKGLQVKATSEFDYLGFVKHLAKDSELVYVGYYVGQVRVEKNNPRSEVLYSNQQKFFHRLSTQIPNIEIVRGHIQTFFQQFEWRKPAVKKWSTSVSPTAPL